MTLDEFADPTYERAGMTFRREPAPRVAVGDRVEVTRSIRAGLIGPEIQQGDRGTVLKVPTDEMLSELRRLYGSDAGEAYVRLDRFPDAPVGIYLYNLRVLDVVDKIGELGD